MNLDGQIQGGTITFLRGWCFVFSAVVTIQYFHLEVVREVGSKITIFFLCSDDL